MTEAQTIFAVEATPVGQQSPAPGVVPIAPRDRLDARAAAPLAPRKPQRPNDKPAPSACLAGSRRRRFALNAGNQRDLFQPRDI